MNDNSKIQYPIRIAHIIGKLNAGGVEAVIRNYYRHIDRSKYLFDFIIDSDGSCQPPEEMSAGGTRCFIVPPYQKLPQYIRALIRIFRENQYLIVHSSMDSIAVFPLLAAYIAKVPIRINHSHNTAPAKGELKKNLLKKTFKTFTKVFATHLCACSRLSAEWLFGKRAVMQGKVAIFNNAIDTEKYAFDPLVRAEVRKEFGIEDAFVIGHVGRFCFQKNQEFLIDLLASVREQNQKAVLMLTGTGKTQDAVREKVMRMGLGDFVIFTGVRGDMERLYQAFDVFVMPSRYEGLPVAAVEAQCAGLPVLISDQVTREVKASDHIQFLPLDDLSAWVCAVQNVPPADRTAPIDPRFNIRLEAPKLESYYDDLIRNL